MTGFPTNLQTLLAQVANLFSASSPPVGVDPLSAAALAGEHVLPLLPAERVYVTLVTDDQFWADPPTDQFLIIRPETFNSIEPMASGGGTATMGTDGFLTLTLWSRCEFDTPLDDTAALSDATYGILALWNRCLTILSQFMPTDDDGNGLCLEPIRFEGWNTQMRTKADPWLLISCRWNMKFSQTLG